MSQELLPFSKMKKKEIEKVLKKYNIGLTVSEAKKIEKILRRPPTITEAVIWGIEGSEHSSYKSSKKWLKLLPTKGEHVILGPVEDSGIVELCRTGSDKSGKKDKYGIVVSHESHNHPSQVVPYEGAATGIGGIVRDVACMGAKVIGTLDPLRFGDIKHQSCRVVAEGVCNGIAGYGNPIGVPNLGGDAYFSKAFNDNCLVNVVALGLVKESDIIHSYAPKEAGKKKYDIIIVGKSTDNSGMGGASFASLKLDEKDKEKNKGAVQEPNPFLKRHLLQSTYDLFKKLKKNKVLNKVGFKDMGAGGIMCATVELAAVNKLGAEIDLDKVPVSLHGLEPQIIACAETQERFAWVCSPEITPMVLIHYNKIWDLPSIAENACATVIGKIVSGGRYVLRYNGETVCNAKAQDIIKGLSYDRKIKKVIPKNKEPDFKEKGNTIVYISSDSARTERIRKEIKIEDVFKAVLGSSNIASRENIYERYDKNIQGISVIESGEADAGVVAPLRNEKVSPKEKKIGVAASCDGNARYSRISPFLQAENAVVESCRNVASVGARPLAVTDCLNYGNPEVPEHMWAFTEGVKGIAKVANAFNVPVISGNVSFYNESKKGVIDPCAVVSCIGKIENIDKAINMQIKKSGSAIFLVGERKDECGASEFYKIFSDMAGVKNEILGKNVPKPDLKKTKKEIEAVIEAIEENLILSCHDISDGGLIVSLAEMTMPVRGKRGKIGIEIRANVIPKFRLSIIKKVFSETGGFVLEVSRKKINKFQALFQQKNVCAYNIGRTIGKQKFKLMDGEKCIFSVPLKELKDIWKWSLRRKMN